MEYEFEEVLLRTDRLDLRPFGFGDVDDYLAYAKDCQGRCENVPAGRSKTVPLNAVEWASRFVGRWRSGSVR